MRKWVFVFSLLLAVPSQAKRLSDWLLEQPNSSDRYPLGLSWCVPAQKPAQNELRSDLLKALRAATRIDPETTGRMQSIITSLSVTGRAPVAIADARWLQVNPTMDPVIHFEDVIVLPVRPKTVTVIMGNGSICQVTHASGFEAKDYIKRCHALSGVDWAYVAQPDGKVQRDGVAMWNGGKADEPAPGAWIWAPSRRWPTGFSEKLIAFLATQGPSPDRGQLSQPEMAGGSAGSASGVDEVLSAPTDFYTPTRDLAITANDWGEAGLLQTPTARMRKAGDFSFTLSHVYPYTRGNVFIQPFDWLEVGFRYTGISNRLYGPVALSGNQSYVDKSLDAKFGLLDESAYLPQISLGFRDIAGTGLFSGEYLVSNKRTGPFDWSLGMGWGYVGGRGDISNPIGTVIPSFNTRSQTTGTGNFALSSYFHGPSALFGGVQYQTPWDTLIVKVEYDGNNYRNEPLDNPLPQKSPINMGVVYRANPSVDLSAGVERGNTVMLSVTLHTDLDKITTPKFDDPPPVAVLPIYPAANLDWSKTAQDLAKQTNWHVVGIAKHGHVLKVIIDDAHPVYWKAYLDRAVAVLHRDAPADIDRFVFVYREKGIKVAEHVVNRQVWVQKRTQPVPPDVQQPSIIAMPAETMSSETAMSDTSLFKSAPPVFESHLGLNFNYFLGGPNGFILYQIAPIETAKLHFDQNTWLQGGVQFDVLDNFDKFTYDAPSNLPRVRTDLREYVTTSKVTMPNLQFTHVGQIDENQYWSVYGGYLEQMFAGAGGEWLYRPFGSRTAFGVDMNEVQQRDFSQNFGLLNYRVLTGHATLYWDTGWQNVQGNLSFGRYLAGDVGSTIDFSRQFDNGIRVGGYFTKTNATAAQFGEGSYDKGIYLSIPFDAMLSKSSDSVGNFLWQPLLRDGGAKLWRAVTLYDVTSARSNNALQFEPAPLPSDLSIPEVQHGSWAPKLNLPAPQVQPKPSANQWETSQDKYENRLQDALYGAHFQHVHIAFDGAYRLSVSLASEQIRPDSRAVGRAARIIMANAPLETREIQINFAEHIAPVVTYDFFDLNQLRWYFDGEIDEKALQNFVGVSYINPTARQNDPLAMLNDLQPENTSFTDAFLPDTRVIPRVERDLVGAAQIAQHTDWISTGVIGAGLVLGSSLLDKPANNFALKHASNAAMRQFDTVGNLLPWVESAGVALTALASNDPELSRTGYAASEAVATSYLAVLGLKYAVGRSRPWTGASNTTFSPFAGSAAKGTDGFPSGHSVAAMAALTPFAMEYDAPWLYGVAAMTDLARIGSRKHWVSDTVAGSLLGYGFGRLLWESAKLQQTGAHLLISPNGIYMSWDIQ